MWAGQGCPDASRPETVTQLNPCTTSVLSFTSLFLFFCWEGAWGGGEEEGQWGKDFFLASW